MKAMLNSSKRFVAMLSRATGVNRPKMHLMLHIARRALREGNPRLHATWADETLNRLLASVGAAAHKQVWHLRVLAHFELTQYPPTLKRRRQG